MSDRTGATSTSLLRWSGIVLSILALACEPADPVQRIHGMHETGRFNESLEPLRALLRERPEDPELHYLYGRALRNTGQPSLALWSLRKASQHDGWEVAAGLELARAGFQSRNWAAAIEASNRVLEADPGNVDAWITRGEAQIEEKTDRVGALSSFERALELDPENFAAHLSHVAVLLALKRTEAAEVAMGELERLADESGRSEEERAGLCVAKASFAKERGASSIADGLYADCLEQFPTVGIALREAMSFFDESGRAEHATELLRTAIDRAPDAVAYRNELAVRLRARGASAEAEEILRAGTELEGDALKAYSWTALADHFVALGDYETAAAALDRALELERDPAPQKILAFADLLAMAGDHDRALEVAERLDQPIYRDIVHARVLLNEGKPREALERFDSVLRLWPDNAAARYYAARAAEQIGDFDRAVEEYRQSIRAGGEFSDAGLRLARLHEAEGAYELALFAVQQHVDAHPGDSEAILLGVRLSQRMPHAQIGSFLAPLRRPLLWARAVAIRASAAAESKGAAAAIALIRGDPRIELMNPRDAPALRALVIHLLDAGLQEEAMEAVGAALGAQPDSALFHEIHGLALERSGAPSAVVRAAYERAVALDSEYADALAALARVLEADGDLEAALALYDRAIAARPTELRLARQAAKLLARMGRAREAEQRLEEHLREHAYDAQAAMQLAQLRLARGADLGWTLALAQRATRFGGGIDARRLLAETHRRRGDTELAAEVLSEASGLASELH